MTAVRGTAMEPVDSFDAIRDSWNDLAARCGAIFGTCEYAESWWQAHGDGGRLLILADQPSREASRVVLPLYMTSIGSLRVLRFLGHGPADQLGPVCDPGARKEAAAAVREVVGRLCGMRGLLIADRLAGDENWQSMLGAELLRHERSPVLRSGGLGWEEWLKTKSATMRRRVRRGPAKLAREHHDLRFRLVTGGDGLDADLQTLFDLHVARWGTASQSSMYAGRSMHEAFAHRAAGRGWLRLHILEVDGRAAAAILSYRVGGVEWMVHAGRDPWWESYGVGRILIFEVVRDALDAGVREVRLGRGEQQFKEWIASTDPGVQTLVAGRGPLPRALKASFAAARRAPASARRLIAAVIAL
jgi:CelD/BcsL family acetyltransferase involved in cellulose biosynthesis